MRAQSNRKLQTQESAKISKNNKLNAIEAAQFISDMLMELRHVAKSSKLETLQSLIELSYYEAFAVANPVALSREEIEHLNELQAEGQRYAANAR